MQRCLFTTVLLLAACNSAPTPSAPPAKEGPAQTRSKAPENAEAASFVAAPGKETVGQVEWASVMRANTIAIIQLGASMNGVQPQPGLLENMFSKVEAIDVDQEVAEASETFVTRWTGAEGCTAQPAAEPPFAKVSEAMANALPSDYAATLRAVREGTAFDVTCKGVDALVVLDAKSRVIAMDRLVKRGDDPSPTPDE